MDTTTLTNRTLQATIIAAGLALAPALVGAQQTTTVTVDAPQIRHEVLGIGRLGARVPVVSASYRANFADLDLATHSGATALEDRVRHAAKRVCAQLAVEDPGSFDGNPPCVKGAMTGGMAQAHAAIAAAEARVRASLQARATDVAASVDQAR